MKNKEIRKLALLGMVSGLVAMGQPGVEAAQDMNGIDAQHMLAKPGCGAHGCGSVAESDTPKADQNADLDDSDDSSDSSDDTKVPAPVKKPVNNASKKANV